MDVVVNPPVPGDDSYELYIQERTKVLSDLKYKAKLVADTFNAIEGISCQPVQVNFFKPYFYSILSLSTIFTSLTPPGKVTNKLSLVVPLPAGFNPFFRRPKFNFNPLKLLSRALCTLSQISNFQKSSSKKLVKKVSFRMHTTARCCSSKPAFAASQALASDKR
jgi:hypothetical protein